MKEVNIYTKTSFKGMKRQDGVGMYVIQMHMEGGDIVKSDKMDFENVTPNAAELLIIIEALKRFSQKCILNIYTDSAYAAGYEQWYPEWQKNGFKTAKKETIANVDQWKELHKLLKGHDVTWKCLQVHSYRRWMENEIRRLVQNAAG